MWWKCDVMSLSIRCDVNMTEFIALLRFLEWMECSRSCCQLWSQRSPEKWASGTHVVWGRSCPSWPQPPLSWPRHLQSGNVVLYSIAFEWSVIYLFIYCSGPVWWVNYIREAYQKKISEPWLEDQLRIAYLNLLCTEVTISSYYICVCVIGVLVCIRLSHLMWLFSSVCVVIRITTAINPPCWHHRLVIWLKYFEDWRMGITPEIAGEWWWSLSRTGDVRKWQLW